MHTLRRIAVVAAVALTSLVLSGTAVFAQMSGTDSAIPEAAPKNWGWQFMGVPVFLLVPVFALIFWGIYLVVMGRLRYPRKRES